MQKVKLSSLMFVHIQIVDFVWIYGAKNPLIFVRTALNFEFIQYLVSQNIFRKSDFPFLHMKIYHFIHDIYAGNFHPSDSND